jgi:hypothetical protein
MTHPFEFAAQGAHGTELPRSERTRRNSLDFGDLALPQPLDLRE